MMNLIQKIFTGVGLIGSLSLGACEKGIFDVAIYDQATMVRQYKVDDEIKQKLTACGDKSSNYDSFTMSWKQHSNKKILYFKEIGRLKKLQG